MADDRLKRFRQDKGELGKMKRKGFIALLALIMCVALTAAGCSGTGDTAAAAAPDMSDAANDAAEETTDDTDSSAAAAPGVYAVLTQSGNNVEITPVPGGITDSTVLPTFKCTFGDMTDEAQKALEEGRVFPKEFFRDLTACMLISEEFMAGKEHDAVMYSLSTLAAMANEFYSLDPSLKNVVYELAEDGSVAKSIYNVHFGAADKDGQIAYDNRARQWYLGDAEYSGSIDSSETLAVWWTVFDVANGDVQ